MKKTVYSKIKVCIRTRPLTSDEKRKNLKSIINCKGNKIVVEEERKKLDLTKYTSVSKYTFDSVYAEDYSNQQIFDDAVRPLLENAFKKFNVSCFAYGQTNSGKTYTMNGTDSV